MRAIYEEIRNFGKCDNTSVGSVIVTDLGGIFSGNTIPADVVKSAEFFAVSNNHRACCNFRSPTATDYPRVSRK